MTLDAYLKIKGKCIDIHCKITNIKSGRDGIGWYEFWGARCFDRGRTYLESFDVENLEVFSERTNEYVKPSARLSRAIVGAIWNDERSIETIREKAEDEAEARKYGGE